MRVIWDGSVVVNCWVNSQHAGARHSHPPPSPSLQPSLPHLCRCRSSMYCSLWYSLAAMQSTVCSTVRRAPSRMVPPKWVVEPSGMNTTTCRGEGENGSAQRGEQVKDQILIHAMQAKVMLHA